MGNTHFIRAGRLIDGSGGPIQRDTILAVRDGLISAIGPASELHPQGVITDLGHCTVVPALVDCSVTLARSPSVAGCPIAEEPQGLVQQHLAYCYSHGVLGLACSDPAQLLVGQEQLTIRSAGPALQPGGQGDFRKLVASDITGQAGSLTDQQLQAQLAKQEQHKVVVVANGQTQVETALAAGCQAIEQGFAMGAENLQTMAKQQVLWIPSLNLAKNGVDSSAAGGDVCCRFSGRYVAPGQADPKKEAWWKRTLASQLKQLKLARELGVKVALGTGAGRPGILHGEAMVEEMKLFMKAGYSLPQVIHSATEVGASFFAMDRLGQLAVGRPATFLLTRGTAQQLPRKLAYLEGIFINGTPSMAYSKDPGRT